MFLKANSTDCGREEEQVVKGRECLVGRAGAKIYTSTSSCTAAPSCSAGELHELNARIGGIGHQ